MKEMYIKSLVSIVFFSEIPDEHNRMNEHWGLTSAPTIGDSTISDSTIGDSADWNKHPRKLGCRESIADQN
jgi:hypothetical protein